MKLSDTQILLTSLALAIQLGLLCLLLSSVVPNISSIYTLSQAFEDRNMAVIAGKRVGPTGFGLMGKELFFK